MDEFSLYVLDIVMNSVRAGASKIDVKLFEDGEYLTFTVTDNGCGMTKEQVEKLTDPFFTTRKTRAVGLGVPFLKMLSEQTGGSLAIQSISDEDSKTDHGTTLKAVFGRNHIDFLPMGNLPETLISLIQGSPEIDFTFYHRLSGGGEVRLSCAELKQVLGDQVSLADFEILSWIRGYLDEAYEEANL